MLAKLPGWVIDDERSVRDEVAEWARTTPAERWRLAILSSRDAAWAAAAGGHRERVLAFVEPLPESTAVALERLRREAGWGRGDG